MTFSRWLLSGRRTITHCIIIYDAIILRVRGLVISFSKWHLPI